MRNNVFMNDDTEIQSAFTNVNYLYIICMHSTHFLNASGFTNEAQSVSNRVAQSVRPNSVQEITWQ